ncbi:hypothetical protein FDI90_gp024 [Pseudomonas phage PA7]|uniref:Uncharacterized protein n=1 Tax=Pseudomonas phage PA7 TaxID=347330 RepID=I7DAC0_9CAUD|nr:hypothetical protein FDI90_gp024 [Pseudomonas phage PA7]AFO70831.1 hypothetical protein [Pseudomonas phage PA7]
MVHVLEDFRQTTIHLFILIYSECKHSTFRFSRMLTPFLRNLTFGFGQFIIELTASSSESHQNCKKTYTYFGFHLVMIRCTKCWRFATSRSNSSSVS